jgi:hypothetical protein
MQQPKARPANTSNPRQIEADRSKSNTEMKATTKRRCPAASKNETLLAKSRQAEANLARN